MFLLRSLDPLARLDLAQSPPPMIDEASMRKIVNNAPKPMVKSEAHWERAEEQARAKLLKGPRG